MTEVAFVTGAASGLGAATARALAARGAAVTLFDVAGDGLAETAADMVASGAAVLPSEGDITDDDAVARTVAETVERFGGLDTVVACAGILVPGSVTDVSVRDWRRVLDVNLTGTFVTARHTIPALIARGGGAFVAISSDAGVEGVPDIAAYCASKHGVIGLVRCIALGYGSQGIRANAVCPGNVRTPMLEVNLSILTDDERAAFLEERPTADPEDVAAVVCHLSSRDARHTNNLVYAIDNGGVVDRTRSTTERTAR